MKGCYMIGNSNNDGVQVRDTAKAVKNGPKKL
jgi:hypothetical protein